MKIITIGLTGMCALLLSTPALAASDGAARMARYNVVWNSPSQDASGTMPVGNGDISASVYAIEDGDLYLLLAKNDAFNFRGDLFKLGRIQISIVPNPFARGKPYRQELDLATGSVVIEADGTRIRAWADANKSVYHVDVAAASEVAVTVRMDPFKRVEFLGGSWEGRWREGGPQDVIVAEGNQLMSYFAVGDTSDFGKEFAASGVTNLASLIHDPFRFNTFGNLVEGGGLARDGNTLQGRGRHFDIRIHALAKQTPGPAEWIHAIRSQAAVVTDADADWARHLAWWSGFWDRSWIAISDREAKADQRGKLTGETDVRGRRNDADGGALVAQSYNVYRYLMAAQSRGAMPAKFNGGLFTQQLKVKGNREKPTIQGGAAPGATRVEGGESLYWLTHPDWRLWGRIFTFQNQRLLYWPLLMSGDADLMQPFFEFYRHQLPVRMAITEAWFGHKGAFFQENIQPFANADMPPKTKPGGPYTPGWHSYYFTAGLELSMMMIERAKYSADPAFRDGVLTPLVREVLRFYDLHYPRDAAGKLRLDPSQALEMYWYAVNPASDVAGLQAVLDGVLALGAGTEGERREWTRFRAEIPELHLHEVEGDLVIAPAHEWGVKKNMENPELYPAFPFQRFGVAQGSADLVARTAKHRNSKGAWGGGWSQDEIHWACAGNAGEARDGLIRRARVTSGVCRFPLYGPHMADGTPNFPHLGSAATALQRMLVQESGNKVVLLPAWPENWDVEFKLHLSGGAVVTGTVKDGRLLDWTIRPEVRRKDVKVRWDEPDHGVKKPMVTPQSQSCAQAPSSCRDEKKMER